MNLIERDRRKAIAKMVNMQPVKADLPMQKFKRGSKVHIGKMPPGMLYFNGDFDAIVKGTPAQLFGDGSDNVEKYAVLELDDDGKAINAVSWYDEDQLTLLSNDLNAGLKIIESYN